MNEHSCLQILKGFSGNLKSKIKNPKFAGVFALVLALTFVVARTEAQQPKLARIGYLSTLDAARDSTRTEVIRLALRELGYIEGQNIAIEYRYAEGKLDRYAELAAELVRLKVDIIVVSGGTVMIKAAQNATKTNPIVMAGAPPDPVNAGLIESLARPGGNVTGITILSRDLSGKRLELFKEAVPKIARVAVLYAPASAGAAREVKEVLPAAARAERECSVLGDTSCRGFREGVRRAEQTAPRWTLPVPGRAPACQSETDHRLRVGKPIAVYVQQWRSCRCRRAYVLRSGRRRQLSAHRLLRGQNSQGRQACRSPRGTTDKIRAADQSKNRKADRRHYSTKRLSAGRSSNPMTDQSKTCGEPRRTIVNLKSKIGRFRRMCWPERTE
jgi:hypothetical protein